MNFVCTTPLLSRYARQFDVPYRGRHVPQNPLAPCFVLILGGAYPPSVCPCADEPRSGQRSAWSQAGVWLERAKHGKGTMAMRRIRAYQPCEFEYSSGAWTRTRTTQLQRLVGCQLPNAGISAQSVTGFTGAATVNPRYRPGRRGGISGILGVSTVRYCYSVRMRRPLMPAAAQPSILR